MLFVAAVAIGASVVTMDSGSDISASEDSDFRFEHPQPVQPEAFEPFQQDRAFSQGDRMQMQSLQPGPKDPRGPMDSRPFDDRRGPGAPEPRGPEYAHDATPEVIEELIPIMVEEDISIFDPGFVEDAIEFARDSDMGEVADLLSKKLQDYLISSQIFSDISTMDTRANGFEEDADEDSDIIVVEESDDEEPEAFEPFEDQSIRQFFKPFSSLNQVNLQLDL